MTYVDLINKLIPTKTQDELVLDLFCGAGGLSFGFEAAGFETIGIDFDRDCVLTHNKNLAGKNQLATITRDIKFPRADIIIAGPPCQPFSVGGSQKGLDDIRNGFPAFVEAVGQVKPKVWLFENVRGITYKNKQYLDQVLNSLEGLGYRVSAGLLRADDYGIPQRRQKFVAMGTLSDVPIGFPPPKSTNRHVVKDAIGDSYLTFDATSKFHNLRIWHISAQKLCSALTVPKRTARLRCSFLNQTALKCVGCEFLTPAQDAYITKYEKASKCVRPRDLYPDIPSRTVTCRNLAGATGDMLRVKLPDGRRRLSIREAARLQSFPDWFRFEGTESSVFKQIGNAVPPLLAYVMATHIADHIASPAQNTYLDGNYVNFSSKQLELTR